MRVTRITAALIAVLLGCRGAIETGDSFTTSDSSGVAVVTVAAPPNDTILATDILAEIGSADLNAPVNQAFELISDLAVTADGAVAVVDNRSTRVGLFGPDGDWLRDIGRQGEGPGEFVSPLWIEVSRDSLFVWDVRLRRLSAFTADGEFAASWPISDKSSSGKLAVVGGLLVDEAEWGQLHDPSPAQGALVQRNRSGVVGDTLVGPFRVPEYGWQVVDQATGSGHMTNPPVFAVGPVWTIGGNTLYVLFPRESKIVAVALTDGTVKKRLELPSSARLVTSDDQRRYASALVGRFGGDVDAVEGGTVFADTIPAYAGLVVDNQERIWVSEHDPAAFVDRHVGSTWTVIDLGRNNLWAVEFPERFRLLRVRSGLAYGIARDETAVEIVHVYRVERGSSR